MARFQQLITETALLGQNLKFNRFSTCQYINTRIVVFFNSGQKAIQRNV